jgi:hypothetical protein
MEINQKDKKRMIPCNFPESNGYFDKPDSMSRDECEALSTWTGTDPQQNPVIISCWKPTKEELEEINRTGRIWCYHWGNFLQPHSLGGHNPFIEREV